MSTLRLYRALTTLVGPLVILYLLRRMARGKEDRAESEGLRNNASGIPHLSKDLSGTAATWVTRTASRRARTFRWVTLETSPRGRSPNQGKSWPACR